MFKLKSHAFHVAVMSALLVASSVASAQSVQPIKCQGTNCQTGMAPGFPQPQVDVNALLGKIASLEQKVAALEAKQAALDAKQTATDGNVGKLMTHTHDVNTSFDFSSTVVSDINSAHQTVVIPLGNFGHPSGVSGQPKFK